MLPWSEYGKQGAAWALVEDTYAPERIAYIRRDCGCVAELNENNWDIVMHTKPLSGFVTAGVHDAAFAIYTSGTTGNPKGVLHEYGNLERAIESIRLNGETPFHSKDRLALLAPLNTGDLPRPIRSTIKELEEYDEKHDPMFFECADMLYMMADRFLKDGAIDTLTHDKLILKYPIA